MIGGHFCCPLRHIFFRSFVNLHFVWSIKHTCSILHATAERELHSFQQDLSKHCSCSKHCFLEEKTTVSSPSRYWWLLLLCCSLMILRGNVFTKNNIMKQKYDYIYCLLCLAFCYVIHAFYPCCVKCGYLDVSSVIISQVTDGKSCKNRIECAGYHATLSITQCHCDL